MKFRSLLTVAAAVVLSISVYLFNPSGNTTIPSTVAAQDACEGGPPTSFMWSGKGYVLTKMDTQEEPGHKVGYVKCLKGSLVRVYEPDAISVHISTADWKSFIININGRMYKYTPTGD